MATKPRIRVKATNDSLSTFTNNVRGYSNSVSGLGTARDKGTAGGWTYGRLDREQIDSMYRTSWLARRGVDTPALDMLRQGWTWGLKPEDQEALDAEWVRLEGDKHIRQALIWSRLHGGAGIFIGTDDEDLSEALRPDALDGGGVKYLTTIPAAYLSAVTIELDPLKPEFGLPSAYRIASTSANTSDIHHSRIVRFVGNERPSFIHAVHDSWGDSVLETVEQTLTDFAAGQRGIGNLLQEASLDVLAIKGMMDGLASGGQPYMDSLIKRTQLNMDLKSSLNALMIDAEDTYSQKTATFSNLHELGLFQLKLVAAAFGMPMTKFFGEPPKGMNSTGEGDERNYNDTISSCQESQLRPALTKLFSAVKPSAGLPFDSGNLRFNPLRQMTEKDAAELNEKNAKTLETFVRTQAVPDGVTTVMAQGMIIEAEATWPGAREAYSRYTDEDGNLIGAVEIEPSQAEMEALIGDAEAKRTLYVRRDVVNSAEIIKWAKGQGFENTLSADDLHVTVIFSKTPVDWSLAKAHSIYGSGKELTVGQDLGARSVVPLGDKGAVVLKFACDDLQIRHDDIRERSGASHDFPSFQMHVTITYDGKGVDLNEVELYQGDIILGPEIFEELDPDWKPS